MGLLTGWLLPRLRAAPEGVLGVHRAGRPAGLRPGSRRLDGDLQVVSPVFRDQEPRFSPWRLVTALPGPTPASLCARGRSSFSHLSLLIPSIDLDL